MATNHTEGSTMTYRERREAKAERYREWAEKRDTKADAAYEGVQSIVERIPFGQPILVGHHSERGARADQRRIENGMNSFCENSAKADRMREKANNIERAAKQAIYSDDPDALDRLREKLSKLEAQRESIKAANAEWLKANKASLKGMTAYQRDRARPYPGYVLTNLGGTITTTRKRIEQVERETAIRESGQRVGGRQMSAKYDGECAECGCTVSRGDSMTYYRATREVVCAACAS